MANKQWDVLGVGTATVDEFLVVDRFPTEDAKQQVLAVDRQGGGLVATALVAAARMGASCAYGGLMGTDEVSQWAEADLRHEGIDLSLVDHAPDARLIHAFIIVAKQTRTILYTRAGRQAFAVDYPPKDAIERARTLLIDDVIPDNLSNGLHMAKTAREAGVPVIADFERTDEPDLLNAPDHLILSSRYAEKVTGKDDPRQAALALWHGERAVVIITCGTDGCWYTLDGRELVHQNTFPVETVDTTGCGDVFHGVYAAGLAWGWPVERRVKLATACAALKARQLGGRRGIPTMSEVEAFLRARA
jgi:sulfofructose kinase